ncbi:MAG: DpnII family type II restriction endonuclease [Thermoanaerobaculia bacterium]
MDILDGIEEKESYTTDDLKEILERDFEAGVTLLRLFLDLSKDEITALLRDSQADLGPRPRTFRSDPEGYLQRFVSLGVLEKMRQVVGTPVTWRDVLVERLKSGRGSAIKAQNRGRFLEDKIEEILREVFGIGHYEARVRFVGAKGQGDEKADFAIPSRQDARILMEVKAYGATGSKQTDILGDMKRIVEQKRHDTTLLFVTDGVTWKARVNDLRKLIDMQNQGQIARIYTSQMFPELRQDLLRLRSEYGLEPTL